MPCKTPPQALQRMGLSHFFRKNYWGKPVQKINTFRRFYIRLLKNGTALHKSPKNTPGNGTESGFNHLINGTFGTRVYKRRKLGVKNGTAVIEPDENRADYGTALQNEGGSGFLR